MLDVWLKGSELRSRRPNQRNGILPILYFTNYVETNRNKPFPCYLVVLRWQYLNTSSLTWNLILDLEKHGKKSEHEVNQDTIPAMDNICVPFSSSFEWGRVVYFRVLSCLLKKSFFLVWKENFDDFFFLILSLSYEGLTIMILCRKKRKKNRWMDSRC